MWHTERYPFSNGVVSNCHSGHADYGIYLKESERCLSDVLTDMGYDVGARGIRTPSHTYVIRRAAGEPDEYLLYNRADDPSELRNSISSEPDVAAHHHRLLKELLVTTQDPWSLRDFDHRPVPFNSNARHRSGFASAASP